MKKIFFLVISLLAAFFLRAQTFPDPDFTNEPYYLKKNDTGYQLVRLEKGSSAMETKTKLGGFGGSETEYAMDGGVSSIRITSDPTPLFIVSAGASVGGGSKANRPDSVMRANGMDPSLIQQAMGGMVDPASRFTLYKTESSGGQRIILVQKSHGGPFASKKVKSSDKYTFSVKKIREGYWELVPDKPLPPGEYAFSALDLTGSSPRGPGVLLFAFGIE